MRPPKAALLAIILLAAFDVGAGSEPTTINWDEAESHVGSEVVVKGRVLGVHCSPTACLLAFEPGFNRFTAVIQAEHFDVFPPDRLDDLFSGKRVQVHGTIVEKEKKPEILVAGVNDLKVTLAERRQEQEEAATRQQAELFDRMTGVLEQLVTLTERMAATQERMEMVLAQMEQRQSLLASAQPAPPAPPAWGEPQPRPAYEALRTVKRGMSPADVERLIGQPESIQYGAGGWVTWSYGFGRSISFDARGRAQSMVGFPAP
ncbi:MAG: hypothetical protein U0807_14360 [Candidatus Binatia bacterium]